MIFGKEVNDTIIKSKQLEVSKKIIGIINNMIYKRSVSNYGLLLEKDFNNDDIGKIKGETIATLQACIDELEKL